VGVKEGGRKKARKENNKPGITPTLLEMIHSNEEIIPTV